jgi:hypothetical protein
MEQITLNYDADILESYSSLREFIGYRTHHQGRFQKEIAADMDLSPSHLARKIAQAPGDSMKFTVDNLEKFIEVTGDTSPVLYLVEKYLTEQTDKIAELEAELARLKTIKAVG